MRIVAAKTSVALFLAFASLSAQAATATVYAHVETVYEPNVLGPNNTSCTTNNATRECNRLLDAPLSVSDPDGVSASSALQRDVFAPGNTSAIPNFILTGNAAAQALPGSLHAVADVQVTGAGGASIAGISGYGYAAIEDQIRVRSSTLADGAAVTLNTLLDITGSGGGSLFLSIRGRRNGVLNAGVFGDTNNASGVPRTIDDIGGSFTAFVGETLNIEYGLRASTGSSAALWTEIDVLNGRTSRSSYGNSAYLYFSSADPAADVFIDGVSGYDYVLPPPVPEPGTALMLLLGLGIVSFGASWRSSR